MEQRSYPQCRGDWKMSSVGAELSIETRGDRHEDHHAPLVIAGAAGSAIAFDAKTFYEQVDQDHN
jgi:hypothetical protein